MSFGFLGVFLVLGNFGGASFFFCSQKREEGREEDGRTCLECGLEDEVGEEGRGKGGVSHEHAKEDTDPTGTAQTGRKEGSWVC